MLLMGKKHYTGRKFTNQDDEGSIDVKGLACVRRDICPFLRDRCLQVIRDLLDFKTQEALEGARSAAVALLSSDVPVEELIMSKQLGEGYKTDTHPHVYVAGLMESRDPGTAPKAGDRVDFVWVEKNDARLKGYQRAEDPVFVASHPEVVVDKLQYFSHQLRSQLGDLFKVVHEGDPFDTPEINKLESELMAARDAREAAYDLKVNKRQKKLVDCWPRK